MRFETNEGKTLHIICSMDLTTLGEWSSETIESEIQLAAGKYEFLQIEGSDAPSTKDDDLLSSLGFFHASTALSGRKVWKIHL